MSILPNSEFRPPNVLLPLTLMVVAFWPGSQADAQTMEAIDSRKIYPDANIVIVFQLRNLEEHLDEEARVELKSIHEWLRQTIHMDTSRCKEVITQFGAGDYDDEGEAIGFLFRSEDDLSTTQFEEMTGLVGASEKNHRDITFYSGDSEPCYYFSENALLICETDQLKALIDNELDSDGERELAILENISLENDVCIQIDFSNKTFPRFLAKLFTDMNWQDTDSLGNVFEASSTIGLTANFDESTPLLIDIEVSRPQDVKMVTEAAESFVNSARAFMSELTTSFRQSSGEFGERSAGFCDEMSELVNEAKVSVSGTTVTISVERESDSKSIVNEFVHMMDGLVSSFGGR